MKGQAVAALVGRERILRIAVVEENDEAANLLSGALQRFARERGYCFRVFVVNDVMNFLCDYRADYDIVFISVERPELHGIEIAYRLRKMDDKVTLVLRSWDESAAMDGYTVRAFSYLLKDADYFTFSNCMEGAIEQAKELPVREYWLTEEGKVYRVQADNIRYAQVDKHTLYFYTDIRKEAFTQRGSMAALEAELADKGFYRINKSYLINVNQVTEIKSESVMLGDVELPVGRTRRKEFFALLNRRTLGYTVIR